MNGDTCDRHPSALALTLWYRANSPAMLTLCGNCARKRGPALTLQRFELTIDDRDRLAESVRQVEPA